MQFWMIKEDGVYLWEGGMDEVNERGIRRLDPRAWRRFLRHMEAMVVQCRQEDD